MYAYDEKYLNDAMSNLGDMLDYTVNDCRMNANDVITLFVTSGIAEQFGNGSPKYVSGMSGIELALTIADKVAYPMLVREASIAIDKSPEYWAGWILAYYQWHSGKSFEYILRHISILEILALYPTLHEASEEKFADIVDKRIGNSSLATRLKTIRGARGISQAELAKKSGVSLRAIQQYEQRVKSINKAAFESVYALAKTLGCRAEDLLE